MWWKLFFPRYATESIMTAEAEVEGLKVDDQLRQLVKSIEVPR